MADTAVVIIVTSIAATKTQAQSEDMMKAIRSFGGLDSTTGLASCVGTISRGDARAVAGAEVTFGVGVGVEASGIVDDVVSSSVFATS